MLKRIGLVSVALILTAILVGQAISQDAGGGGRRGRGGAGGGGGGNMDPAAMRQRALDRVKENLKATDEEWKILEPKVSKVMELRMQTGFGGMMGGRRGGPGGPGGQEAAEPTTDVQKKAADLRKLLDDSTAKPDAIKAALKGYREARDKAKADLTAAQKDLRGVVNLRQESQLVLTGMLE
jgi:hypothetical protein